VSVLDAQRSLGRARHGSVLFRYAKVATHVRFYAALGCAVECDAVVPKPSGVAVHEQIAFLLQSP